MKRLWSRPPRSSPGISLQADGAIFVVSALHVYATLCIDVDIALPGVKHGIFVLIVLTFSEVTDSHPVKGGNEAKAVVTVIPAELSCCCF